MDFGSDILKLAELLKPPQEPEEEIEQKNYLSGDAGKINKEVKIVDKSEPKSIEEFELEQEKELEQAFQDTRKEAAYDIKYRQAVTPEDIFLQMGAKTPSTASCEDMVVTVQLPGESFSNLELDVLKEEVKVRGFSHRLELPLPCAVDPDQSKAHWDTVNESLVLTLHMDRELDYINF